MENYLESCLKADDKEGLSKAYEAVALSYQRSVHFYCVFHVLYICALSLTACCFCVMQVPVAAKLLVSETDDDDDDYDDDDDDDEVGCS